MTPGSIPAIWLVQSDAALGVQVVLTPPSGSRDDPTPDAIPMLSQPFEGARPSRNMRLVAAKPALLGALQARFRAARHRTSGEAAA